MASTAPNNLSFLTWEDYIDEDIVKQFEEQYNAKVKFTYFESDDARDEILSTTVLSSFDLIMVDSTIIPFYANLKWISPFEQSKTPNLRHASLPNLANLKSIDEKRICSPYFWGTTGIAYRQDLVTNPITSWGHLLNPAPELQGKILMPILATETVGIALKFLGYSILSSDMSELDEARELLLKQEPFVAGYSAVATVVETAKLVTGEVSAVVTYNSDALMLKEREPLINYIVPEEGGHIWADFICLSAEAKSAELAHQFVNFINKPKQALKNALYTFAASPNAEARKLLPVDILKNSIIYPNPEHLAKSELYGASSPRSIRKRDAIMNELKRLANQ